MRSFTGIVLLSVLWLAGGGLWYFFIRETATADANRGHPSRYARTAPPSDATWAFETEQHWLADEIGRDIAEMTLFAKDTKMPVSNALEFNTKMAAGSVNDFTFSAKTSSASASKSLGLQHFLWASENFIPWANTLLDSWQITRPSQNTAPNTGLLKSLASPGPETLVKESQRISGELTKQPLNAELHEEAALVLGYFGLQEAGDVFADTRRTLCRMSAHLALARALQVKTGSCGQVAEVIQLSLVKRQTEALEKISLFPADLASWATALKIRNTGDWRILDKPEAASLLEQTEHGRALVNSVGIHALLKFLRKSEIPPVPAWNRIALERNFSVEAGHLLVKPSLAIELQALAQDWKTWSNKDLQEGNLVQLLNDPPTRALIKSGEAGQQLEVLSWGAIASFHQRHLCQSIKCTSYFLRSMWGVPDVAAQYEQTVNDKLAGMRLYPIVLKRIAQDAAQYARAMKGALEMCKKQPDLLSSANWICLLNQTTFGNQHTQVPQPLNWFAPVLPLGTGYDFYTRYYDLHELYKADLSFWKDIHSTAPYDCDIIWALRYKKFGDRPTALQVQESFVKISDYHLIAMKEVANTFYREANYKGYEKYMRKVCELDPDLYLALGAHFLKQNQIENAVFAYQAAYEMAPDRIRVANGCDWLVNYYFDHNRQNDALKIATEAAEVYSFSGLETMARLMERMDKLEEAEKHFAAISERYDASGPLASFYIRNQDKKPGFTASLQRLTAEVFPDGMEKVVLSDFTDAPTEGVLVKTTNNETYRAALKLGDVFVALDGIRIRTKEQYHWARDLKKDDDLKLILWNGTKYVEITANPPGRRFNNEVATFNGP